MRKPEIISAFENLSVGNKSGETPSELRLKDYIGAYAVSLPALIRAFPRGGLDVRALEAHYWDRLRRFYKYDDFKAVKIEESKDVEFINQSIKMIEAWFYSGNWTECLKEPTPEEFKLALKQQKSRFLLKARGDRNRPNLGRDRRGHHDGEGRRLPPLPDIFEQVKTAEDLQALYRQHAFKFFHGPSAVINTLTKIETTKEIITDDSRFKSLIARTGSFASQWQKSGSGQGVSKNFARALDQSIKFLSQEPAYIQHEPRNAFKRELFFMKTVMGASELVRRYNPQNGTLGFREFEEIMALREREMERAKREVRSTTYLPLDFSGEESNKAFGGSSVVHVNVKELPMALMAVEYMRQQHLQEKNKK